MNSGNFLAGKQVHKLQFEGYSLPTNGQVLLTNLQKIRSSMFQRTDMRLKSRSCLFLMLFVPAP